MGKSLRGKELGKGIRQREDGLYQARFTNRFGKRQVIYDKTYNGKESADKGRDKNISCKEQKINFIMICLLLL